MNFFEVLIEIRVLVCIHLLATVLDCNESVMIYECIM
jgi:hypothetical protein